MAEVEEFFVENEKFVKEFPAFMCGSTAIKVFFGRFIRWRYTSQSYQELPGPIHVFEEHAYGLPRYRSSYTQALCGVGTGGSYRFRRSDVMFDDEDARMCPKCVAKLRAIQRRADKDAGD